MPDAPEDAILPDGLELKKRCKALALLEAALSPDWSVRRFLYDNQWDPARNEEMASMRGGYDGFFIVFSDDVIFGKFFAETVPLAQNPAELPGFLAPFANEPAFDTADRCFYAWSLPPFVDWNVSRNYSECEPLLYLRNFPSLYAQHIHDSEEVDSSSLDFAQLCVTLDAELLREPYSLSDDQIAALKKELSEDIT